MSAITPTLPPGPPGDPSWIPPRLHRITVEQYEAMAASGILPEGPRVQLINGLLVERMPHKPPHAVADGLCGGELRRIIPPGWHLRAAQPVRLPEQASEPEPDHCVAQGRIRDYEDHHPGPADVALVAEVSDSSLAEDRKLADAVYGPAGIPVYWIIDLVHRRVEVRTGPGPAGYASTEVFTEGQSIPVVIDGREIGRIAVADILPSRGPTTPSRSRNRL